jgi:hypothetical protein
MKIRITKKGLPKAQMWNSQPGVQMQTPAQSSYNWMNFSQEQVPLPRTTVINPDGTQKTTGNFGEPTIQYRMSEQGTPLNQGNIVPLNTRPNIMKTLQGVSTVMNAISPVADLLDTRRKNKEIEQAYRDSLVRMGPVDYTQNRGDYEINTGMVDPYNTGAKSKGQFAGAYYTPMAQDGLSLGPISFSEEPVRRNVYQTAPLEITRSVAASTYVKPPVVKNMSVEKPSAAGFKDFIAAKESGGNYRALPKDSSGKLVSSAAGKYQFLWNQHKGWISKVTGVSSKEEFLNNPEAQEKAFEYWDATVLTPNANKIKQQLSVADSVEQIKAKIHFAGPAGAYRFYSTGQETRDAFGTTTSTYEMGGENTQPMKIRITQEPMDNMEYGGQLGYGFDLGGRRVYTDMPESTSDTVNNTIGPVPREMANIEAEKGETMLSDVDDDGMMEHMKIGGKRHSEGGTPLAAKPGDFIFSDTKKMKIKNPALLALFGKSAKSGGYTPAQLAKQYDINKYKAILQDPNSDAVSKRTAEMMLGNYEKKLGMISLVQEAKKGFPQGIPAVAESVMPEAKFGGYLEEYQVGGSPRKMTKAEYEAALKKGEFKQIGNSRIAERTWQEKVKDEVPGQAAQFKIETSKGPGKGSASFNKAFGDARKAGLKEFTFNGKKFNTGLYKPGEGNKVLVKAAVEGTPAEYKERKEQITYDEAPGIPTVPDFTPSENNTPYGWTQQDINNALLAMSNRAGIKKYPSVRRDFNPVMPDFRNMDWRGKAAELQGTYNSQMNTLGTYQSPTSLAANASFMAGQQAENLINRAIEPTEQQNVQIYNQVSGQRAGIMNQALANAAQNTFLRSQDRAVLNQQYDNAVRDANAAMIQTINQGMTNASGIYNTNLVESPYYFYDPRTQKMKFNSENARAAFEAARRSAGPNESDMAAQYMTLRSKLTGVPEDKKDDVAQMMMGLGKTGRTSSTTYPFNPTMNRTTVQQPFNPYYNPYLNPAMRDQ